MIQIAKYIETDLPFQIFALGLFDHTNYPFQIYAQIRVVPPSILFVLFLHKKSILLQTLQLQFVQRNTQL